MHGINKRKRKPYKYVIYGIEYDSVRKGKDFGLCPSNSLQIVSIATGSYPAKIRPILTGFPERCIPVRAIEASTAERSGFL